MFGRDREKDHLGQVPRHEPNLSNYSYVFGAVSGLKGNGFAWTIIASNCQRRTRPLRPAGDNGSATRLDLGALGRRDALRINGGGRHRSRDKEKDKKALARSQEDPLRLTPPKYSEEKITPKMRETGYSFWSIWMAAMCMGSWLTFGSVLGLVLFFSRSSSKSSVRTEVQNFSEVHTLTKLVRFYKVVFLCPGPKSWVRTEVWLSTEPNWTEQRTKLLGSIDQKKFVIRNFTETWDWFFGCKAHFRARFGDSLLKVSYTRVQNHTNLSIFFFQPFQSLPFIKLHLKPLINHLSTQFHR